MLPQEIDAFKNRREIVHKLDGSAVSISNELRGVYWRQRLGDVGDDLLLIYVQSTNIAVAVSLI
ncbi:hypothetical protein [Zhongshania aliphaticivorans]|uniref:hypothetical protein n=1 Tax=Zhongshania aliphaticivorans TaxID=1470434 RepID=UPI001330ED83|nr:hypothetical protein [Zhongshania aliphaticivorans]